MLSQMSFSCINGTRMRERKWIRQQSNPFSYFMKTRTPGLLELCCASFTPTCLSFYFKYLRYLSRNRNKLLFSFFPQSWGLIKGNVKIWWQKLIWVELFLIKIYLVEKLKTFLKFDWKSSEKYERFLNFSKFTVTFF